VTSRVEHGSLETQKLRPPEVTHGGGVDAPLDRFCSQAGGTLSGRVTEMGSELPNTTTTEL